MKETSPKPFVFVLIPFSDDFNDIYQVAIKPACIDAGAYCERVDEQIFMENILERIYNQLAKADIIVAEMTGRNVNVFYETGYAHALNKRVILLTKNAEDIPFDLKQYPHIVYGSSLSKLKSELKKRVHWCIENLNLSVSGAKLLDISGKWRSYHSLNKKANPVGEVLFRQWGERIEGDIHASKSRDGKKTDKHYRLDGKFIAGQLAFTYEHVELKGLVIGAGVLQLSGSGKELVGKITYFHRDRGALEVFDLRLARMR